MMDSPHAATDKNAGNKQERGRKTRKSRKKNLKEIRDHSGV